MYIPYINDNQAITAGVSLWAQHGQIPTDVNLLADSLGLQLHITQLAKSARAMLVKLPGENKIICDSSLTPERQRYAIAHELAHELIHLGIFNPQKPYIERACQVCAASMLMPPPRLQQDAQKLSGKKSIIYDLSNKYFVSRQAMRIQLKRLGLIKTLPFVPAIQIDKDPLIYNGKVLTRPDLEKLYGPQLGTWCGKPLFRLNIDLKSERK